MDAKEYKRRELFLCSLKTLGEPENLEILRVLQKKDVHYSENTNGVFFDVASLTQQVFNELEQFLEFVRKNRADLSEREEQISEMKGSCIGVFKQ
jgi:hypothetical protein